MHRTPFAGLTAPDDSDPITVDGGTFLTRNPDLIDRLLQIGAVTHRHDGHAALSDPQASPSASVAPSGGQIPAGTSIYVGYTLSDSQAGETRLSPMITVASQGPIQNLAAPPLASADYSGGSMPVSNLTYGVTYVDAGGGETPIGPPVNVSRLSGFASGQIRLSGLSAGLASGLVSWRLWKAPQGGSWALLAVGTADTFTDTGLIPSDPSQQPPTFNSTNSTNLLSVQLPTQQQEPRVGSAAAINLYLSSDGSFTSPALYSQYPVASAGQVVSIVAVTAVPGSPPPVSTCTPGANPINPDTDLLNYHWKTPVAGSAALPSGSQGDVRVALDTGSLYAVLGSGGAAAGAVGSIGAPNVWSSIPPGGGAGTVTVAGSANVAPAPFAVTDIEFAGSGAVAVAVQNLGGGLAQVVVGGQVGDWDDSFSTDSRSAYTYDLGGISNLAWSANKLTVAGFSSDPLQIVGRPARYDGQVYDSRQVLKGFVPTATPTASDAYILVTRRQDNNNKITAQLNLQTTGSINVYKWVAGAATQLATVSGFGGLPAAGNPVWLVLITHGDWIRTEVWTVDPDTAAYDAVPLAQVLWTAASPDLTLGAGLAGGVGWAIQAGDNTWAIGHYRVQVLSAKRPAAVN